MASSAQISASAEETSAQSGVVSSAAEEVSRSVMPAIAHLHTALTAKSKAFAEGLTVVG